MTTGRDSPGNETAADPALERAWRAHSRESPPPALDRAILAAAHRAVGSGPQDAARTGAEATRPQRWWMPLAAAATIGVVAIGILQVTPDEELAVAPPKAEVAARAGERVAAAVAPATTNVGEAVQERARETVEGDRQHALPAPRAAPPAPARAPMTAKLAAEPADTAAQKQAPAAAPEPRPFPATPSQKKTDDASVAEGKLEAGRSRAAVVGSAKLTAPVDAMRPEAPAGTVRPEAPAAAVRDQAASGDARAVARKDAARGDMPQRAAPAEASAPMAATPPPAAATAGTAMSSTARAMPQSAPARARESEDTPGAMRQQRTTAAPPSPPPAALAKTVPAADEPRLKARDPAAWIARIRKLRDDGNAAEAAQELRAMRLAIADADLRLPADMREWAASVKP